jgi:hypothetical protein
MKSETPVVEHFDHMPERLPGTEGRLAYGVLTVPARKHQALLPVEIHSHGFRDRNPLLSPRF